MFLQPNLCECSMKIQIQNATLKKLPHKYHILSQHAKTMFVSAFRKYQTPIKIIFTFTIGHVKAKKNNLQALSKRLIDKTKTKCTALIQDAKCLEYTATC